MHYQAVATFELNAVNITIFLIQSSSAKSLPTCMGERRGLPGVLRGGSSKSVAPSLGEAWVGVKITSFDLKLTALGLVAVNV
jgi:hypothetical protein